MNDPWQEIIQHYELVMEPNQPLKGAECEARVVREYAIVKPQEESLEL